MENDSFYQLALSSIPGIGVRTIKTLLGHFEEARDVLRADKKVLSSLCGGSRSAAILGFDGYEAIEKERSFLERHSIRPLFITHKDYPKRLLTCEDAPVMLFYRGNADLNTTRVLSVIGTRTPTDYGRQMTAAIVKDLTGSGTLIVSGMAYGIDGHAHQASLDNNLSTIGVLGHGLKHIYPREHRGLAGRMVRQGGVLTQFNISTQPDAHNFPIRNRIVAGMSDALLVVETGTKGGSLLTVQNAISYQKKIFALPGRATDPMSAGCNALIRDGKAVAYSDAEQLMNALQWTAPSGACEPTVRQASLFPAPEKIASLSEYESSLLQVIRERGKLVAEELYVRTRNNYGKVALALLNLELQGFIRSSPGKIYQPCG